MVAASLSFVKSDGSLVPMDKAKAALSQLCDIDDVSDFARKAEAAKRACAETDERRDYFAELAIWAQQRLGELLKAMPKNRGTVLNGKGVNGEVRRLHDATTDLATLGIEKTTAHRSQKLAAAGPKVIESYIAECRTKGKEITKGGALAVAKRHLRGEQLKAREDDRLPTGFKVTGQQTVVTCDAVITDPPYGILSEAWEPEQLEAFTRDWLSRWKFSGAKWFVSFFSQQHMWSMRQWMDDELKGFQFNHLAIWHYPNGMGHKQGQVLKESWEPVFIYRSTTATDPIESWDWGGLNNLDCIREAAPRPAFEGESEQRHPCQKPVRAMKLLVTAFCPQGGLVADPFCGSGTTGIAAKQCGRKFHGIETDAAYRKLASSRILQFGG